MRIVSWLLLMTIIVISSNAIAVTKDDCQDLFIEGTPEYERCMERVTDKNVVDIYSEVTLLKDE